MAKDDWEEQEANREFRELLAGASEKELQLIRALVLGFINAQAIKTGEFKLKGKDVNYKLSTN